MNQIIPIEKVPTRTRKTLDELVNEWYRAKRKYDEYGQELDHLKELIQKEAGRNSSIKNAFTVSVKESKIRAHTRSAYKYIKVRTLTYE